MNEELAEKLDAVAATLSKRAAGVEVTRSDVVRVAIERGLEVILAESKPKR
jgi:hypothetical protein